jgi:lipid II:glycine glycyltransferase (peptidoglycan interpeptide bridge formation enzyme)
MAKRAKFDLDALEQAASGASNKTREIPTASAGGKRQKKLKTFRMQILWGEEEIALIERAKEIANISGTSSFCRKYALDAARRLVKEEED